MAMARRPGEQPLVLGGTEHRRIGDYIVVGSQPLGRGSFGQVWKAYHKHQSPDRFVAIKEVFMENYDTPKMMECLETEMANVQKVDHPNVVGFHTVFRVPGTDSVYLVMEYCSGGDLQKYIQDNRGPVSEEQARSFMRQLGAGLLAMKDKGVIHRDLKPQNILFSTKGPHAVLKIADFGFSKAMCCSQGVAQTNCGTVVYRAPEMLLNQYYDAKVDLWSAGAILYELLHERRPSGQNPATVLQRTNSTKVRLPDHVSPECKDMCRKLLRIDPARRMSHEEFVAHPFVQETRVQIDNNRLHGQMTFMLFPRGTLFPGRYRRATVEDVSNHRQAFLKAMPGWEIANLANGSVDGAKYGGHIRLQKRKDVGHKLAAYAY